MRRRIAALALLLVLLALGACAAPQNVVVLLPDPDQKVGKVAVSNAGGSQELSEAGQATFIKDWREAPQAPAAMAPAEIERRFGAALAARPTPPEYFLLHFRSNSTELVKDSLAELPKALAAIQARDSVDVSVVGHCDTRGDDQYNLRLSRQRAAVVARWLTDHQVSPGIIEITSHGKRRLLVPTGDQVAEPRNRRVEVTVR